MRFRSFWPAILWSVAILVLSTMSGKSFPSADWMDWFRLDKWIHAFLYFVLFILLFIPINERRLENKSGIIVLAIIYCLVLGATTELIQAFFLVGRSGDLPDMIANTFGVFFGAVLIRIFYKKWPWNVANG